MLFTDDKTQGLTGRLDIWRRALDLIASTPITGLGFGAFGSVLLHIYPLYAISGGTVPHAHQLFLQIAIDIGIPGLLAYLALLITALCQLWLAHRLQKQEPIGYPVPALTDAAIAAIIGMCSHGLIDCTVWGNKGAFLPWAILALGPLLLRASLADKATER